MRRPKTWKAAKTKACKLLSLAIRLEQSDHHGFCGCVTCTTESLQRNGGPWHYRSGNVHAGHFLGGRYQSILFEPEIGINCQCRWCNTSGHINHGYGGLRKKEAVAQRYHDYMLKTHGQDGIDACYKAKWSNRKYSLDELIEKILWYDTRIKLAKDERGLE